MGLLTKIFGTYSDHELKKIYPIAVFMRRGAINV